MESDPSAPLKRFQAVAAALILAWLACSVVYAWVTLSFWPGIRDPFLFYGLPSGAAFGLAAAGLILVAPPGGATRPKRLQLLLLLLAAVVSCAAGVVIVEAVRAWLADPLRPFISIWGDVGREVVYRLRGFRFDLAEALGPPLTVLVAGGLRLVLGWTGLEALDRWWIRAGVTSVVGGWIAHFAGLASDWVLKDDTYLMASLPGLTVACAALAETWLYPVTKRESISVAGPRNLTL